MFGLFGSNPVRKLRKAYNAKLEAAMLAQRNGDIRAYSLLSQEADTLWRELEPLEKNQR